MIAYFDCFSGISGDMTLGALVDAGVSVEELRAELAKLSVGGYRLIAETVVSKGLRGTRATVEVTAEVQHHRGLADIEAIIGQSPLTTGVKEKSIAVFHRLAEAEARVHHTTPDRIHFHEVGAVDAIVDVVGSVIGLELLRVRGIYSSALPTGSGVVSSEHGILPVPAPATLELCREASAPLRGVDVEAELVTPTGAALLCTLATFSPPSMRIRAVGYGFGRRELPWANALRLWLGEPLGQELVQDSVSLIETNLDDMTPQAMGAAMEKLLALGALDVYFTPIQMKKNRPAVKLSIIAPPELSPLLAEAVLTETTSLGLRVGEVRRLKAVRWQEMVDTPWGPVRVKVKKIGDRLTAAPEYDDCLRLAKEKGLPFAEVHEAVRAAASAAIAQGVIRKE